MARLLLILPLIVSFAIPVLVSSTFRRPLCVDSIYNFGDSISDTGNLVRQINGTGPFSVISKYPYGMSLLSPPTGRCSDGLLILDHMALEFRLPVVPPYLDPKADFSRGINFAVAGATALDAAFFPKEGILPPYTTSSLAVQLEWFKAYKESICPKNNCPGLFDRSLFFIGEIGGNDFNYAIFSRKSIEQLNDYVPLVINQIIHVAQEVIDAGAIRLVVPGNFPIGCLPAYLSSANSSDPTTVYDANGCLKGLNMFAEHFNQELKTSLEALRNSNKGVTIIYADYYNAMMNIIKKARHFGFMESSKLKACCGAGGEYNFAVDKLCGNPGTTVCDEPYRSISWDGIHLTHAAYRVITKELLFGRFNEPKGKLLREKLCF